MELELQLPGGPVAPTYARKAVDGLSSHMPEHVLDDLRLLATEVVTNSVRHAAAGEGTVINLRVRAEPSRVRLEVEDPGPGFDPTPGRPDPLRPGGWGLFLVDRLASRWGVDRGQGTRVWLEVEDPAIAA